MSRAQSLAIRLVAEAIFGVPFAVGVTLVIGPWATKWFGEEGAGIASTIVLCGSLAIAAVVAGYFEPSVKIAWVHAPAIMAVALLLAPLFQMCDGFECAPYKYLSGLLSLYTLPLAVLCAAASYFRRRRATRRAQ
jgi:hypothetical protein